MPRTRSCVLLRWRSWRIFPCSDFVGQKKPDRFWMDVLPAEGDRVLSVDIDPWFDIV
jgi:hypothetical protein